jgi:cell division protein FtsZ
VDANIIFGAVIDDALGDEVRVTVIAAGFDEQRPSRPASAVAMSGGRSSGGSGASSVSAVSGSSGADAAPEAPPAGTTAVGGYPASSATASSRTVSSTAAGASSSWGAGRSPGSSGASVSSGGAGFSGDTGHGASRPGNGPAADVPPATVAREESPAVFPGSSGTGFTGSATGYAGSSDKPGASLTAPGGEGAKGSGTPAAGAPDQPSADGYVPAPVSFVSPEEDEEFTVTRAYSADSRDDRAGDGASGTGSSAWKDSGRPGPGESSRVFDVSAGRRRPVVFEEDDDLDVPDFLK